MTSMQSPEKTDKSMAERLAHLGAKIDRLIAGAVRAKEVLKVKEESALKQGELAVDEIKEGLEKAWLELNQAWGAVHESKNLEQTPLVKQAEGTTDESDFPGTC